MNAKILQNNKTTKVYYWSLFVSLFVCLFIAYLQNYCMDGYEIFREYHNCEKEELIQIWA